MSNHILKKAHCKYKGKRSYKDFLKILVLLVLINQNAFSQSEDCNVSVLGISASQTDINKFGLNWQVVQDNDPATTEPRSPNIGPGRELSVGSDCFSMPGRPINWSCGSYSTSCSSTSSVPCTAWAGSPVPSGTDYDLPIIVNYSFVISPDADFNAMDLKFGLGADDFAKVCINGIYIGNTENVDYYGLNPLKSFTVTNALFPGVFQPGTNVISVSLYNTVAGPVFFKFEGAIESNNDTKPFYSYYGCAIYRPGFIYIQKFLDVNNNGVKDSGEPGIPNWPVNLSFGEDCYYNSNYTGYTDANGYYLARASCDVIVEEEQLPGFIQTYPAAGNYTLHIERGQTITGIYFGNSYDTSCETTEIVIPEGKNCVNNAIQMKATGCSTIATTFNWSFGDGTTETGENVSHIYQSPGTYNVQLIIQRLGQPDITINRTVVIENCIEVDCKDCIGSFQPSPGKYVLSLWVKEDVTPLPQTFYHAQVEINFTGVSMWPLVFGTNPYDNKIIDGWQRIEETFVIPPAATNLQLKLLNTNTDDVDVYYDDIRIFPVDGQMKTYVYDPVTLRLSATLDENNYATFYEYDEEGKLIRVKKETEKGVMTIQESREGMKKK